MNFEIGPCCDIVPGAQGLFGHDKRNPIPGDAYAYCRRLRCPDGHPYNVLLRANVGAGPDGHIVDRFQLACVGGEHHLELYFDMYHPGQSSCVPEGVHVIADDSVGAQPPASLEVNGREG